LAATVSNPDPALIGAISDVNRTPDFKLRDKYRHPLETLEFFGIRPDMTVIEVLPGGGWYTEILAPYLKEHGHLIEALPPTSTSNAYEKRASEKYISKLKAEETAYGTVAVIPFEPPTQMALGPVNREDLIVTFLNIHDLVYMNAHHEVTSYFLESFFKSAFTALKPGGVLGVVEHCAPNGTDIAVTRQRGFGAERHRNRLI
jgi:predicted methyltransferase